MEDQVPKRAGPEAAAPGDGAAAPRRAVRRRWEWLRRLAASRRLLRAEAVFLAGLAAFAVFALLAKANAYFSWDRSVAHTVQSIPLPGMEPLMRAVSFVGDGITSWGVVIAALVFFLARGRRSEAFGLLLSAAGGPTLNRLVKYLVARPRPTMEHVRVSGDWAHESFPSGHVTFYVCFFGFLFFVAFALLPKGSTARRVACGLAALPVLLVGLSRVYLGAHWPSDTLGAYLFSGLWLAFSVDMYRRWKRRATFHTEEEAKEGGPKEEGTIAE
ncbi:MAG: phosphatase PAP2 family protein [Acidobacteria bacterium]|nr:phosphatase PAP2 family protein [Acidobacteriota bacterium]MCA1620659.1 phosphatase PAP2 family protein [Acidobacteriota bacterium]